MEPEHSDPNWILDLLPHGVLVLSADWRVLYANPEAVRMVGTEGATLWERCPEIEHTAFASGFRYAMADRTELLTESALPRVGWTQARAKPTPDGGLLISLRQVNPHLLESGQAKQVLMMGEIGDAMTREESLHSALQRCTTAMVRHLEASAARVWTIDSSTQVLELCASSGLTDTLIGHQQHVRIGEHKIGQMAEDGEPYLTNDVATDPHVGGSEWVKRERIVSFAGYPLRVEDRIVGVMAMYSRRPLDHDVLNALSSSVDLMALGIARKTSDSAKRRAEATLRAQAERLEILYELGKRLSAELDVTPLAQQLIDTATRLAGAQIGAFFYQLPGTVGTELTSYTVSGAPKDAFEKMAMPRLTPLFAPSFSGEKVVRVDDLREDEIHGAMAPHFGLPPRHPTVVSYLSVPVIARAGRRIGVILLGHGKPAMFGPDTERLIASMASTAAISMDNARLFQEARGLITALEKSNAELDQFAYVASHDLKAPLRGIANISQWIEDDLGDRVDDQARDHLQLLRGRVLRLENLIAGILAYSRAGRERSEIVEVDVRTLATDVWELLAPPPTAKLVLGDKLPRVSTPRVQLQQVLMNLIGNAIKYNPGREVTIELAAKREGDMWNLSVADDGIGVPAEFHERIWGLFQTLERRDKIESTGIGLSVVRKIVESQKGRTWVENRPGGGAAFHFTWPVMKGDTDG
ncbi:MAG: GAF domain-containing protein [Deltaproteobacteria bacterium]|nr:GAF domain-containing protein [Deltaproteobacteria bacterium]